MSRRTPIIVATALVASLAGLPFAANAANALPSVEPPSATPVKESSTGSYIVQLDDAPVAEYDGSIAGLSATRVVPGGKLLKTATPVVEYVKHLVDERQKVLQAVPGVKKLYDYSYTYAGFSAQMSYDEAVKLASTCPSLEFGSRVEVREVEDLSTFAG